MACPPYRISHIVFRSFLYRSDKGFGDALGIDAAERQKKYSKVLEVIDAYMQPISLSFRQSLRICPGDRCSAGRNATLNESDAGKSRMRGGYGERKFSL